MLYTFFFFFNILHVLIIPGFLKRIPAFGMLLIPWRQPIGNVRLFWLNHSSGQVMRGKDSRGFRGLLF